MLISLTPLKFLLTLAICWQLTMAPGFAVIQSKFYSYRQPSFDGTGKVYMGREIAQVMGYTGAEWLERADRAKEEQPQKMVAALGLNPTDTVADVGAGTGYISQLLAQQVPQGQVLSIDLQPEMIDLLQKRVDSSACAEGDREKITNIKPQLATNEQNPGLLANSVDLALMVDAYHEFNYPQEVMTNIVAALKPGGRVVLTEYRGEDPLVFIKPHHKTTQKQIRRELAAVGLTWQKTEDLLPQQHLLFFTKAQIGA
jgi:ubiquinone/menaquinone biosynthesis C-methylase UbiE